MSRNESASDGVPAATLLRSGVPAGVTSGSSGPGGMSRGTIEALRASECEACHRHRARNRPRPYPAFNRMASFTTTLRLQAAVRIVKSARSCVGRADRPVDVGDDVADAIG